MLIIKVGLILFRILYGMITIIKVLINRSEVNLSSQLFNLLTHIGLQVVCSLDTAQLRQVLLVHVTNSCHVYCENWKARIFWTRLKYDLVFYAFISLSAGSHSYLRQIHTCLSVLVPS